MASRKLGPWTKGLVNTVPAEQVPLDALVTADNVHIDRAGSVSRRPGWTRIDTTPARCLFKHSGKTYGVVGSALGLLDAEGLTQISSVSGHVSWTVVNSDPVFCDSANVKYVSGESASPFSTDTVDGEEELTLAPIPGGQAITYWQGRLVVARGTTLFFSEPLRYGVYDQMRSFIRMGEQISWIAALQTGIYVGLRTSVVFLAGAGYNELTQSIVAGPSWQMSGVAVSTEAFSDELVGGAQYVAAWMSDRGFAIGLPNGNVAYPQADRLKGIPLSKGSVVVLGDRITVLTR